MRYHNGLLAIMEFLILIGAVVVLGMVINLRGRVHSLEQQMGTASAVPLPGIPVPPPFPQQPLVTPLPPQPSWFDRFVLWLKEDWLIKLGALLLLIGFGWLATYAFLNNWIGPMGRIALGIVAGTLFLLFGWWRMKRYIEQGSVFLVLGSTTILLTLFAAREIYDFFTPLSALAIMFLSTAFVALASVQYRYRSLAFVSLILAGVAPLLTNAPQADYVGLFSYLFAVVLGAIWITLITGQRELTTAALLLIAFYSLPHLASFTTQDRDALLLFAYGFAALFFITNTAGILKLKGRDAVPDLVTAAGNGMFLLTWIMTAAPAEWRSLIISAWMVVFAIGAFAIFTMTGRREPLYVYAGVAIGFLAAATAAELDGATLTIAYTIESAAIAVLTHLIVRDVRIAERVSALFILPVALSLGSIVSPAWATGVIHEDFFVILLLALSLFGVGLFFMRPAGESEDRESKQLNALLFIVGSVYAYALLWLSLHAALTNDDSAVMIALIVYTIVSLVCYFYGLAKGKKGLQIYGGALLGLVVGRLLLVDVWKMELTGRIITFFLIGALLVSTAFLGRKKKERIELPRMSR